MFQTPWYLQIEKKQRMKTMMAQGITRRLNYAFYVLYTRPYRVSDSHNETKYLFFPNLSLHAFGCVSASDATQATKKEERENSFANTVIKIYTHHTTKLLRRWPETMGCVHALYNPFRSCFVLGPKLNVYTWTFPWKS